MARQNNTKISHPLRDYTKILRNASCPDDLRYERIDLSGGFAFHIGVSTDINVKVNVLDGRVTVFVALTASDFDTVQPNQLTRSDYVPASCWPQDTVKNVEDSSRTCYMTPSNDANYAKTTWRIPSTR